ncbi:Dedicator of cytokinesis protein 2-like [Oopsacas minuta]|uniref:Dedicator of cytokinesis protein 2-like n=1 Tax=Oopsacas minuta TaxID=111878 RepID=A0AAV7JNN9_9METZ|nr:Dedicator of cytokinesis protein 2-like [Oopsacas minuta]
MENVYTSERERDRKEYILKRSIEYFDRGKAWEMGIILCKELGKQYEEEIFDYVKLSDILQTQAKFYVRIIQELRFPRAYFKAGFFGKGFPLFLRNKSFVYQGNEYEKLNDFMFKLQEEFPNAQLMSTTNPPEDVILNSESMHLQIYAVEPIPQDFFLFRDKNVPEKVYEYYKGNSVITFIYNKAYHVGKKDKENEFASMWIERTNYITREEFPGILKWSEVASSSKIKISPLENALQTVELKNKEIESLISKYKKDPGLSINPLSMALNGVIDAAVMGGISNYQKAFFNDNYLIEHPEHNEFVQQLNVLIVNQIEVLREGLILHSQRVSGDLKPFHEKMETCFIQLERNVFGRSELTASCNVEKTIGTYPISGISDDPAKLTQSLFVDIRNSEIWDDRCDDSVGGRSPKKKHKSLFVVPKKRKIHKIKNQQTAPEIDLPPIPKKERSVSLFPEMQDHSITNQPLPPIPFNSYSAIRDSESIATSPIDDDQYIAIDESTAQVLRENSLNVVNLEVKRHSDYLYRNSKASLQSDDTNMSYSSSTDLDDGVPPPPMPQPFVSHSNGPQPPVRRHAPPVPKKEPRNETLDSSHDNLHVAELSQSLQSVSPPPPKSRTFSVVDMRRFEVQHSSSSDTSLPEIPPHNYIQAPKRKTSLSHVYNPEPTTTSPPPIIPPREKPSESFLIQQNTPPPVPHKEPPPVPKRPYFS